VVDAILQAIYDASADVASLAIKCAPLTLRRGARENATLACGELCGAMLRSGKDEERRDAAAMGLKTIVNAIGTFNADVREAVIETSAPALAAMIDLSTKEGASTDTMNVAAEAIDVLHAMLTTMSAIAHCKISAEHVDELYGTLLKYLEYGKSGTRKRAAQCLAFLAISMNDETLKRTMEDVVQLLRAKIVSNGASDLYTFILGATARAVGYHFGNYVDKVIPVLLDVCNAIKDDYDERSIVNLEGAFLAIENIVSSYPSSVHGDDKVGTFVSLALKYVSYDPNFDDDETDDMDAYEEDDDEEGYSDDEQYDDDDDESWKVRRAAAKVLNSVVSTAEEATLISHYDNIMTKLVLRTKDRESSVQLDIFAAIHAMIRTVSKFCSRDPSSAMGDKLKASVADRHPRSKCEVNKDKYCSIWSSECARRCFP
jgi:cullin-associated NEDD8-dissociated protein 1